MKLVSKFGALSLFVLLASNTLLAADIGREFTKTIKKEFTISQDGLIDLSNQYGEIKVLTWEQGKVKIDVQIVVNAGSEADAQKVFDRVSINFTNASTTVSATTVIGTDRSSSWWNWGGSKTDFKVNYLVYIPQRANLNTDAKYCNVFAAVINGNANFKVKYGNIKADGVSGSASIDLAYGNGTIGKMSDLNLNLAYGNLTIEETRDLRAETKYASLRLSKSSNLTLNSRYDTYELGTVGELRCEAKYGNFKVDRVADINMEAQYTNLRIREVTEQVRLSLNYGGGAIDKLHKGFKEAAFFGRYADFKVAVATGAGYQVDIVADHAGVQYPSEMDVSYEMEKSSSHHVKGKMGSGGNLMTARLNYGGFKLNQD